MTNTKPKRKRVKQIKLQTLGVAVPKAHVVAMIKALDADTDNNLTKHDVPGVVTHLAVLLDRLGQEARTETVETPPSN